MPQTKLTAIDNRYLFSNHYLENRLPTTRIWKEDELRAHAAYKDILKLYVYNRNWIEGIIEGQLELDFIQKVFNIINPHYLVNHPINGERPDYVFFLSEDAKRTRDISKSTAVGDAKRRGTPFHTARRSGTKKVRTPTMQIYDYFITAEKRWGILTDGKFWRLLCKEVKRKSYYQALLQKSNSNHIR